MDILKVIELMKGKTICDVNLKFTEDKGETLTISFTDETDVQFFSDDIRTKQ